MKILKVLDHLENLEFMAGELYRHFGKLFSDNRAASEFFRQLSVEEDSHVDMIKYERRLVIKSMRDFSDVDFDIKGVEDIIGKIRATINSRTPVSLKYAVKVAIALENSAAEKHKRTVITRSNPSIKSLIDNLGSADTEHTKLIEDFSEENGIKYKTWIFP